MALMFTFMAAGKSYVIVADASLRENHQSSAQVTDHQVEKGSDISDHVRPMPDRVSIESIVSNTPIIDHPQIAPGAPRGLAITNDFDGIRNGFLGNQFNNTSIFSLGGGLVFPVAFNRAKDTDAAFLAAVADGALINVYTSSRSYTDMVIESYDVPKDAQTSKDVLKFSMSLKKVRFVTTQLVTARAPQIQKVKKTNKPPKAASKEQEDNQDSVFSKMSGFKQEDAK